MKWISLLLVFFAIPGALAQNTHWVDLGSVRVCPADASRELPDFTSADCEDQNVFDLDPQGQMLWARFSLNLPEEFVVRPQPTGLFLSASASSRAYLNGAFLGENGRPGINRSEEIPGRMDAILFVPPEVMQPGQNELVLLMSSHHGAITFASPIHRISLGRYARAQDRILWFYAPSLVPLGLFILGILVFGLRSLRSEDQESAVILTLACMSICIQLSAEVSRGLLSYEYPFHATRIILIVFGAAAFGFFALAHTLKRFTPLLAGRRWLISSAVLISIVFLTAFLPGFDQKTALMLFVPYAGILALSAWAAWRRKPNALVYCALAAIFIAFIVWRPQFTLDIAGFYIAAALFIFLMIEQAAALIRARQMVLEERGQRARLELALEQVRLKEESGELQLTSAGAIRRLPMGQIVHIQAAGDYAEFTLEDGRCELFTISLSELETRLPDTFLRVHRSHIVNSAFVSKLNREANGVGELILSNAASIPVSRRIMPKVRSALSG